MRIVRHLDGRDLLRLQGVNWSPLPIIKQAVAREFECDIEDIDTYETGDMEEVITVYGKPVAVIK